jgi:hypothetical protein
MFTEGGHHPPSGDEPSQGASGLPNGEGALRRFTTGRVRVGGDRSPADRLAHDGYFPEYERATQQLLANYFYRNLTREQGNELVGKLLFPANGAAQALYVKHLSGRGADGASLAAGDVTELRFAALFPNCARGVELERIARTKPLSPEEFTELYGLRTYSKAFERHEAKRLTDRLQDVADRCHAPGTTEEERRVLLIDWVRSEIVESGRVVCSNRELALISGLHPDRVRAAISTGLTPELLALRQERLVLRKERRDHALPSLTVQAVRNLVRLEHELHQEGAIGTLSYRRELAGLFGVSLKRMELYLRFVDPHDRDYRETFFDSSWLITARRELLATVAQELQGFRLGSRAQLTETNALGTQFGLSPTAVDRFLREELPEQDRILRSNVLRLPPNLPERIVGEVRDELQSFERGEISSIQSDGDLATRFRVGRGAVCARLLDPVSGLTEEEQKRRALILTLQRPLDRTSAALRIVTLDKTRAGVEKIIRERRLPTEPSEKREGERGRIQYQGIWYDSLEESACALLLKKYVPGFRPIPGMTHQIPISGKFIDFLVHGIFVEYHPIAPMAPRIGVKAFESFEEYKHFQTVVRQLEPAMRREVIEEVRIRLADRYRRERQELLRSQEPTSKSELVVATSIEEFYYYVVRRLGQNVPSKGRFQWEFERLKRRVRRQQKSDPSDG